MGHKRLIAAAALLPLLLLVPVQSARADHYPSYVHEEMSAAYTCWFGIDIHSERGRVLVAKGWSGCGAPAGYASGQVTIYASKDPLVPVGVGPSYVSSSDGTHSASGQSVARTVTIPKGVYTVVFEASGSNGDPNYSAGGPIGCMGANTMACRFVRTVHVG